MCREVSLILAASPSGTSIAVHGLVLDKVIDVLVVDVCVAVVMDVVELKVTVVVVMVGGASKEWWISGCLK